MKCKIEPLKHEHVDLVSHWREKMRVGLMMNPDNWAKPIKPYAVVSDCGQLIAVEMTKEDAESIMNQFNEAAK